MEQTVRIRNQRGGIRELGLEAAIRGEGSPNRGVESRNRGVGRGIREVG